MRYLKLAVTFGILACSAFAQTSGEITGEVKDQSGAIAPGVPVTALNTETNASRTTSTNGSGIYSFPSLNPGKYTLKVEAPGFQTSVRTGIELQVQQTARIDITLAVGQASQTVEVSASGVMLTTESASVGTVIQEKSITDLPLNGRNFLQLVALSPNVSYGFAAPSIASGRQGGDRVNQNISIAGMRGTMNNYTLDGVSDTDVNFNLYILLPSVDALQEFKVQSGIYPAEFGREAGQINVSTKSGTNQYHGTVFEFMRNSALDAIPYDFAGTHPKKSPFRWNQYGFTLSGPVSIPKLFNGKDRLFFMSNMEGFKSRRTDQAAYTVPLDAWRKGDFSSFSTPLFNPYTRVKGANGVSTAQLFPGNIIPPSLIDPISVKLYSFLPSPNLNTATVNNNLQSPQKTTVDKIQFTQRIDFAESASSQWFGRYSWTDEDGVTPSLPLSGQSLLTNSKQYMVSNTRVLSPSKVNEFRFGYTNIFNAIAQELSGTRNVVSELGLPFSTDDPLSWGIPAVSLATGGLSGFGNNTNGPFVIRDKIIQGTENFSWIHGKHSLRFGGEFRYDQYNQAGNQYTRSQLQFNGQYTANPANGVGGTAAADFLMGTPFRTDLAVTIAKGDLRAKSFSMYLDDTYKLSRNITVTLGLRWEVIPPWTDVGGTATNFQFKESLPNEANVAQSRHPVFVRTGNGDFYEGVNIRYTYPTGIQTARDGRLGDALVNTDWRNFAPRFGIAYSPSPNWSVRTGFGIFYSQETANSKFDLNRGLSGRVTQNTDATGPPTVTYRNFFNPAVLPVQLTPGLLWAVASDIHTPYSMMYLFNVQRMIGNSTTFEVGYTGVLHRHLQNQINAAAGLPGITAATLRSPYPEFAAGGIELTQGWGTGNYNSLSGKLSQRFKSGLTTLVAYTWSKALDDGSAIRGTLGDQYPENNRCIRECEWGPSGFNTPHRLVTSVIYELPFGKGKQFLNHLKYVNGVVSGWQLSTIFTAQSGRPLYPTAGWDAAGQVVQPNSNRFNATGKYPYAANPTQYQWFDLTAFTNVTAGNYGTAGRNSMIGPSTWNADVSVVKNVHLTEKQTIQVRFETFNTMNHVALGSPITNWGNSTQTPAANFGKIQDTATSRGTANDMRQIQAGLKYSF